MKVSAMPLGLFVTAAFAIAAVAFCLAQVREGAGMVFALAVSIGWTVFVQARSRKAGLRG